MEKVCSVGVELARGSLPLLRLVFDGFVAALVRVCREQPLPLPQRCSVLEAVHCPVSGVRGARTVAALPYCLTGSPRTVGGALRREDTGAQASCPRKAGGSPRPCRWDAVGAPLCGDAPPPPVSDTVKPSHRIALRRYDITRKANRKLSRLGYHQSIKIRHSAKPAVMLEYALFVELIANYGP